MKEGRPGRSDAPFGWRRRQSRGEWVELGLFLAGFLLVIYYRPFAHLSALRAFEERHGGYLLDDFFFVAIWSVGKLLYLHFFRRGEWAADQAAFRGALRQGRVKRMPLWARWLFILCFLGLIILGWTAPPPHRTRLLALGVPLFLLFCAVELNLVVHPGETLLPDPRDELLAFFKSRMLQAGYVAAIAALVALYLVYLFVPAYIGLVLPLVLAACLLVPSLVYIRLDRRAAADG
ncbi:MAG TPA: hypothetical protein VFX20_11025 [Steroidobacteraceae bacterium]|nr:hypothetical protein [Steroidobacteraceae bacterium]